MRGKCVRLYATCESFGSKTRFETQEIVPRTKSVSLSRKLPRAQNYLARVIFKPFIATFAVVRRSFAVYGVLSRLSLKLLQARHDIVTRQIAQSIKIRCKVIRSDVNSDSVIT